MDNGRSEVPMENGGPSSDHEGSSLAQVFTIVATDVILTKSIDNESVELYLGCGSNVCHLEKTNKKSNCVHWLSHRFVVSKKGKNKH